MATGGYQLTEIVSLPGHTERVWNVSWSPSGKHLASCGGDKTVRIWAADASGKWGCRAVLEEAHQRSIRRVAWSRDGKYLACASFDATTSIWKCENGEFECIATLEGHENEVKCVSWDISGSLLATCSRDKSVWIWEMESEQDFECVSVLHGHTQDVKAVVWHPTREILLSCSYDNTLKLWNDDGDDWYCSETLSGHSSTVWDACFDETGDQLVSCSDDNTLIVWRNLPNAEGNKKWKNVCTLSGYHRRCVYSVDWSPLNKLIATGAGDDAIRIFQENTEEPRDPLAPSFSCVVTREKAHGSDINCVRWHPKDPTILASCGDDNQIKVFHLSRT